VFRYPASLSSLLFVLMSSLANALVIDNFSEGEIVLNGPGELVSMTNMNPQNVVGGSRHVQITGGSTHLSIDSEFGLQIQQGDGFGYFHILYGYDAPLGVDLTENGNDRLRLRFDDVDPNWWRGSFWISVNTPLPPNSSSAGPNLAELHGGGIVEIPFSAFNTNFQNVNTLAIAVSRIDSQRFFTITEFSAAGPSQSGDFDRNGFVDAGDLIEWQHSIGRKGNLHYGYLSSDEDRNGIVDGADFLAWQRAMTGNPAYNPNAQVVPEPSSLSVLLSLAVGSLSLVARQIARKEQIDIGVT